MSLRVSKDVYLPVNTADLLPEDDGNEGVESDCRGWFSMFLGFFTIHPSDWHIVLNETIETIDWDSKSTTLAQPLGNFFTFTFYAIRLLQFSLIKPNLHRINERTDHFDLSKSKILKKYAYLYQFTQDESQTVGNVYYRFLGRLGRFFDICIVLLILMNGFITYKFIWGDFRMYCLFYLKKGPHLKHVTRGSLRELGQDNDDGSFWSLLRYFWDGTREKEGVDLNDDDDENIDSNDTYYKLFKWIPSQFVTMLFVSFSPTALVFLLLTEVSFPTLIAVIFHQWVLHHLVVDRYSNRLVHESVIASANLGELEAKFIKPRMSKRVQDVAIDCTPHGDGGVKFCPAMTTNRPRIFQTHSLKGELITETFNPSTKQFEDLKTDGITHNVVRKGITGDLWDKDSYFHGRNTFESSAYHPHYTREASPTGFYPPRISPRLGQYSPLVSSTSGMSTPFMRPERPSLLNARPFLGEREELFRRENSKSPLRQNAGSLKPLDRSSGSQSPIRKYDRGSDI